MKGVDDPVCLGLGVRWIVCLAGVICAAGFG